MNTITRLYGGYEFLTENLLIEVSLAFLGLNGIKHYFLVIEHETQERLVETPIIMSTHKFFKLEWGPATAQKNTPPCDSTENERLEEIEAQEHEQSSITTPIFSNNEKIEKICKISTESLSIAFKGTLGEVRFKQIGEISQEYDPNSENFGNLINSFEVIKKNFPFPLKFLGYTQKTPSEIHELAKKFYGSPENMELGPGFQMNYHTLINNCINFCKFVCSQLSLEFNCEALEDLNKTMEKVWEKTKDLFSFLKKSTIG